MEALRYQYFRLKRLAGCYGLMMRKKSVLDWEQEMKAPCQTLWYSCARMKVPARTLLCEPRSISEVVQYSTSLRLTCLCWLIELHAGIEVEEAATLHWPWDHCC